MIDLKSRAEKAAKFLEEKEYSQASSALRIIVFDTKIEKEDNEVQKIVEKSIYMLADVYVHEKSVSKIATLIKDIRSLFSHLPKAKVAKIVRSLVGKCEFIPESITEQINLVEECIAWTTSEKRSFLRQRLQARLGALLLEQSEHTKALKVISELSKEVKSLDDKLLLVEIQITESKIYHGLRNIPKSKAALTAARTSGNAIYCPPPLQGLMDMQAGVLHGEENDFKTAYSYFYEAFENYHNAESPLASEALKFMVLTKIMMSQAKDVKGLLNGKAALKYSNDQVTALQSIAEACSARSLKDFEKAKAESPAALTADPVVKLHLATLYGTLLEQNLQRILEPYSCVELSHVAKLIELDATVVERKLSQMILESKLNAVIDQGTGEIILYEKEVIDDSYTTSIEVISELNNVVNSLFEQAKKLE